MNFYKKWFFPWIFLFVTSSINSISDPSEYTDNSLFSLELDLSWILLEVDLTSSWFRDLCREELCRELWLEWRLPFLYLLDFPSLPTELLRRRFLNRRRFRSSFKELPLERYILDSSADSRCPSLILCTVSQEELRSFERKSARTGPNSSSLILEQARLESSESEEDDVLSVFIFTLDLK